MANWFAAFKVESSQWYQDIAAKIPPEIKLFHPDDLHMTISFLGNYNDEKLEDVKKAIESTFFKPFNLYAHRFILLPKESNFSAFCLEFDSSESGLYLQIEKSRENIYKAAGITPDKKKFIPHVTMGRPPRSTSNSERKKIADFVNKLSNFDVKIYIKSSAIYTWSDNRKEKMFKIIFEKDF
jgi:2'-5' RNA ligase